MSKCICTYGCVHVSAREREGGGEGGEGGERARANGAELVILDLT